MRKMFCLFTGILFCSFLLVYGCSPANEEDANGTMGSVPIYPSDADHTNVLETSSDGMIPLLPLESSESWPDDSDTSSDETSAEVSYPDPVCSGDHIDTPRNPDEEPIPIRSVRQTEKNTLLTDGAIHAEHPETAAVLQQIRDLVQGYDKRVSFFAYALDGSRAISYNCEETYFSACTIKASFMLYCCMAIDQGLASKDQVMYYQEKYYHGGSGVIQFSEFGTPYTLEKLIELCLSRSDNVAYEMLSAYFGHTGYNEMINALGVERLRLGSSIWNYQMTARDLAIIWREVYFYFQTDTPMARLYKQSCTNTRYNYATIYLKESYSHKSGDNFGKYAVYNDGAIVWADRPYVVTILTNSEGKEPDVTLVGTIVKLINDQIMK